MISPARMIRALRVAYYRRIWKRRALAERLTALGLSYGGKWER